MGNKINKYLKFLSLCIVIVSLIIAPSCANLGGTPSMPTYDALREIESFIFSADATEPTVLLLDSTHFIAAYGCDTPATTGIISTYSMDEDYQNITLIDELVFFSSITWQHSLIKIDDTHVALAFGNAQGVEGYLKTFSVDENFDNITEIDSLNYSGVGYGYGHSLLKLNATHLILASTGSNGEIRTFSIDENYDNITEIAYYESDMDGYDNQLIQLDTTHFIWAFGGYLSDGYIRTFSIDGNYDNVTVIDTLEHDTTRGTYNAFTQIDDTHFLLAYCGVDYDGFLKTFSIDGNYDNITEIADIEHDEVYGYSNFMLQIDNTHYILAYRGNLGDGYIKTILIDESYGISIIDSLNHDSQADGAWPAGFVQIDDTHYLLSYNGEGDEGYFKTFATDPDTSLTNLSTSISALRSKWWLNTDIQADVLPISYTDLKAEIICLGNYTRERYLLLRYDHVPARDEQNVQIGKAMQFRLYNPDPLFGIDLATFKLRFNGGTWYRYGDPRFTFTEVNYREYLVYFNPPNFTYDSGITIEVYCEDNYNNPGIKLEIL